MGNLFSLEIPEKEDHLRQAFRCRIPGLKVHLAEGGIYAVSDLSATGFALHCEDDTFHQGAVLLFDMFLGEKPFLKDVQATVVRLIPAKQLVGLTFHELGHRQEERLDKLILEVQKRMIARRKSMKDGELG